jgi:hypothetical protein
VRLRRFGCRPRQGVKGLKQLLTIIADEKDASLRPVNCGLSIITVRIEDIPLNKSLQYFLSTPHWLDALPPPIEPHLSRLVSATRALLAMTNSAEVEE